MEGPAMEWKSEEYSSDEAGGKMGWILSNGVSLGKKLLAACVVVSSAPLVVPPLVVVSTIFMISLVPYCLFLASYACTQKLMNTLLPTSVHDGGSEETRGVEKDGFEEPEMEDEYSHVDLDGEGVTEINEAEPMIGVDEASPSEANPILIQSESETREEEPTFEVTNKVMDVKPQPGVPKDEEMKNLIENIRDEGGTDEVHERTPEKALQEDEKPLVSGDSKGVEDLPEKKEAHKGEADKKQNLDGYGGKVESTITEAPTSSGKDEEKTPNEVVVVVYSEEQIWEKMDAVRKIVGYKDAKGATCAEELKALYVFTGVEPSTPMSPSFKNSVDVAEISNRLCFLMSVIGIK